MCVSCSDPGWARLHLDCSWEGLELNNKVFLGTSMGQKLAGIPPGAQMDMTPSGFLGGQDYSQSVAESLRALTKALLSM